MCASHREAHPHSPNFVPPIGRAHKHVKLGNRFHFGSYRGTSVCHLLNIGTRRCVPGRCSFAGRITL